MTSLIILILVLLLPFVFIVFFGAPFVPTFNEDIKKVLSELDVTKGTSVVDLGSGDGRVLLIAALRGASATGYELNPWLWFYSWIRTRSIGHKIDVQYKNYLSADIIDADIVFVFTSSVHKKKLEEKLLNELSDKTKVVSNGFKFNKLNQIKKIDSMLIYEKS